MAYIEIRNVTKAYGNQMVLNHVSVSWERGKIHGLTGRNGSGKTQLFKCLCGYAAPDSGVICVDGQIIGRDRPFPQSMELLIDGPGFLPDFSDLFNLQLLAVIRSELRHHRTIRRLAKMCLLRHLLLAKISIYIQ